MPVIGKNLKETVQSIAQVSGMDHFFIQDTETTGIDINNDQIYEIAGIEYDHGVVRPVHYYLDRPEGVSYDKLKNTTAGKNSNKKPWANIISDKDFDDLKSGKISDYHGGKYLSTKDAANFIKTISSIPNITYNAIFDISMEMKLDKSVKFNNIYDAATMVIDVFPQILQIEDMDDLNKNGKPKTGHWNLQLIYKYLRDPKVQRSLGLSKSFPSGYGGKILKNEEHTAYSDTVNMLIPVLGVISDIFKKNPNWKWENFKNKQAVATYFMDKQRAQYKKAGIEMKPFNPATLKKVGADAQGFLTLPKKVKLSLFYLDVDSLLFDLPEYISSGEKIMERISTKTQADNVKALKKLTKDIAVGGKYNTGNLLRTMDASLRKQGFFVDYYFTGAERGILEVVLIPNDEAFILQLAAKKVKPIIFKINLQRADGLINLDGRKAINKLFTDYQGGKAVVITAEQAQLIDVIQYINSGTVKTLAMQGRYDLIGKRISEQVRQSMHTLHTVQNYVSDDTKQEESKNLSGTGTARQRWIRENYLDNSRYLTHIIDHNEDVLVKACLRAGFQGVRSKEAALSKIIGDLNDILSIFGTLGPTEATKELNRQRKRLGYLTESNAWRGIVKSINQISTLHFHPGISSENSLSHMTVSLMNASSLTAGGMTRLDTRHQQQIAATRALSGKAKEYRGKLARQGRIFNEFEVKQNGINHGSVQEALSSYAYITQNDINKAYKEVRRKHPNLTEREFIKIYGTGNIGIHNDASVFSLGSDFQNLYLDSFNKITKVVKDTDYQRIFNLTIISMVEKGRILTNFTQKELTDMLSKGDTSEIDKIYSRLDNKRKEEISRNVIRSCLRKELNLSNVNFKDVKIDYTEVDYTWRGWRVPVYVPSKMESGTKILSKVDGFRTNAQGIHQEVFQQILADKGVKNVDLLKELPEEFSSEGLEGLIIGYLNNIVSTVFSRYLPDRVAAKKAQMSKAAQEILNVLNMDNYGGPSDSFINALKGLMRWDNKQRSFIMIPGALQKAMKDHKIDGVLRSLNQLGASLSIPKGFVKIKDGVWNISREYVGMSAVNQAQVDEYGDPSQSPNGVVKLDYRARQSIESSVALARGSRSSSLKGIEKYILGQMKSDSVDSKKYNSLKKDIEKSIQITTMSASKQFQTVEMQTRKNNAVSVGYGTNYDVDISKWDTNLYEDGQFSKDLYNNSLFKKIEEAKKIKAKQLGVKSGDVEVYLDLEKTYTKLDRYTNGTGRGAAIRYLFLPKLSPLSDDWSNMEFPDMPSYVREFNRTISGIRRIHESNTEGWSKNRIDSMYDQVGDGAFGMIERSLDVVNFKDSSIWQGGNSRKVTHSGNGVATAGNASWITDKTATKIQKQIASTDSVISFEDAIAAIKSDGVHKSDSEKQVVKKRLAHLGVLKANIDYLWEGSLNENTVQKVLTNALSEYVSKRIKFQPNMTEAQQRDLVQKELKSQKIIELKNTLLLMLGFNKNSKDYSYLSTDLYEQEYKQVSDFLTDFIAESVTIGSIIMGDRVHQERGLQVILGRYPFSNGLDLKYTQTYIDKNMTRGRITVGLGVGRAFNLDYDGDHVPYWLAMMSGEGLGSKAETIEARWKKNAKEFEVLKNWQKRITSFLALTESEDIVDAREPVVYPTLDDLKQDINAKREDALYYVISEGNAYRWNPQKGEFEQTSDKRGAITQSTADELFEFQQQVKAVLAGRKYKTQTGSLSNIYQMVANTLHEHGFDEMGLRSKNKTQRERAIRSLVVRAFYEAFTQDAISSKKVFNRLKGNKDAKETFYSELSDLVEFLKREDTYTDQGLNKLFVMLNKMGLSTISDRIAFQVLVTARVIDKDGSAFNSIFGAGAASKFNLKFKNDGEIESINGISFETDRERAMAVVRSLVDKEKGLFNKNDHAAVKRAILGTDEDLRNFGDREISGLARAINNTEGKKDYGMHMANVGDYGEAYTALLQDITEDAQKIVQKNWNKIAQEQNHLHNKKYFALENGKNVKFEASMESFKQSINAFKTAADKTQRFSIFGIHTGLDTTNGQHRTYIDSSAYGDDYDTYEFLNNYIKSGAVYSVTQLAGVLHIGDYKSSNTYPLEYGTMIHNIIEKILQPRVNNKLDQKLSECFKNVETAPDAASTALKEWLLAQWTKGNADDQTDVMACFKDGQIEPIAFGNAFKEVASFIKQVSENGYLKDSEFATQFVEKTTGIIIRNGEESFIISGTIDQLWHAVQSAEAQYELSDFKTSKYAYLEYVIQLSLYNAILKASNIDINKYGKLFVNNLSGSSVVDIEALSADKLFEFISEAIPVLQCTDASRRSVMVMQLANKWNPRLMNQMTLRLTQDKDGKYLYGGSSLSEVVKNLDKNFPVTQKEANLRIQYDQARAKGEPYTGSLEQYVAYLHRSKNMSNSDYQEHLKFRGYRAQIVQNYINSYESETARGIVQDSFLRYGKDNYSNLSIISDYYAATHSGNKVKFYDVERFQNEFKVDENTYNYYGGTEDYGGLGFNRNEQTGGEDEMALVEDLIKFLQSYTPGAKGSSSGGTAPGRKVRYTDPDSVKISMEGITNTEGLLKEYAKELHKQEIDQLELQLFEDKNSVEYKIAEQRYKNKYEGLEWDSDKNSWVQMKDSNGKEFEGVLTSLEKRLYVLLHNNVNGDKDTEVSKRDAEADAETTKKIEEAKKMKNDNLDYQKEIKDVNQKIEQQELKILEKKKKLYGELLVLQERLNVAKREGNQEEVDSAQSLVDAKQAEYDKAGKLAEQEEEKRKKELQPKLTKINEDDRKQKERQYNSLLRNRESLSKQIYRNQQAQKLTYSVQERRALQDEAEILNEQWNESEESILGFRNKYSGYWDIQEPDGSNRMTSLESRSSTKMARDMASIDVSNRGQHTLWGQLGSQMTNTLSRFTQMGAAYKIIGQVRQGINQLVTSSKELDKSLTNLRIVTGANNSEARQMLTTYSSLGDELGATTTEVANSAEEWLRQGYEMNEVTDLVTASIYLSKLGMMDASTATKDLTSAMKGFKLEASDAMSIVDKFTALDVEAATTAGDIAEGLAQFANTATLNGVDIDQASAMVATIADITQESGSSVGNSIKMMLSRYSNVKSGAYTSDDDGEALNDTEKILNKLGISMRDNNLQFRDFADVLAEIADRWDSLDNISQNAIAGAIAGTRQREQFTTLVSNYSKYEDLLDVSKNSDGTAEKKYKSYQEQLEAQQKKVQAAWEDFANRADVQQVLIDINRLATVLIKHLPGVVKYLGRYVAISNAYRVPKALTSLAKFVIPSLGEGSRDSGYGSKIKNFGYGIVDMFTGRSQRNKINEYNSQMDTKSWMSIWKQNTSAIQQNTAALLGRKTGGAIPTGVDGKPLYKVAGGGVNIPGTAVAAGSALDLNGVTVGYKEQGAFKNMSYDKDGNLIDNNKYDYIVPSGSAYASVGMANASIGAHNLSVALKERRNAKKFERYSFDHRDTSQPVVQKGNGYEYTTADGGKGFISKRQFQNYQSKANQIAFKNYTKVKDENGMTQFKSDKEWLNNYAASGQQEKDQALMSNYIKGDDGKWYTKAKDGGLGDKVDMRTADGKALKVAEQNASTNAAKQANVDAAKAQKKTNTQAKIGAGVQGVAGAVTGALTASQTAKVKDANGNYVEYQMSDAAGATSRASTAVVQGLGSMISPALGSLLGMGMDALNTYVIGPMIDGANIAMQARVKEAQTQLSAYSSLSNEVSTLKSLANKDIWTTDDQDANDEAVDAILEKMYKKDNDGNDVNKSARETLVSNLKEILKNQGVQISATESLGEILNADNDEDKKKIAHALELATAQANTQSLVASYESDYEDLANQSQDVYSIYDKGQASKRETKAGFAAAGAGIGAAGAGAAAGAGIGATIGALGGPIGAGIGTAVGAIIGSIGGIFAGQATYNATLERLEREDAEEWSQKGLSGQIKAMEDKLAEEEKKAGDPNSDFDSDYLEELRDSVNTLKEIRDQTKSMNKKIDQATTSEALIGATDINGQYLSMMTTAQLKGIGVDEIKRLIGQYLVENGGYTNDTVFLTDGNLSTYADKLITSALKNSDTYSGVVTGKSYTLSEALQLKRVSATGIINQSNLDILQNFATALHVSIDDLGTLQDKFGELTLTDFLMTATEAIEKLQDISSLMSNIANTNKSWAETTKDIITNYPSLIKYLDDGEALQEGLWEQASKYAELQINGLYDSLESSTAYFTSDIEPLLKSQSWYSELESNASFGEVDNIASLRKWLLKYADSEQFAKISKEINNLVSQQLSKTTLVSDLMREQINTVLEYQETLLQNQIDNLTEQKTALEEINKQREYENNLIEAKLKLEDASKEKKRVYREGVGWSYESDQTAIAEAQKNLEEVENQKAVSELEVQISELEANKKALEDISNQETLDAQRKLYKSWCEEYSKQTGMTTGSIEGFKKAIMGEDDSGASNTLKGIGEIANNIYQEMIDQDKDDRDKALYGYKDSEGIEHKGLDDLWDDVWKASHDENGNAINWNTATDAQKNNYNSALEKYQTAYNNAVNSGYITDDYFKQKQEGENGQDGAVGRTWGSAESQKEAKEGDTQDTVARAYVYSAIDKQWHRLTSIASPSNLLYSNEINSAWDTWDADGKNSSAQAQLWTDDYNGAGGASGKDSRGYMKSNYDDFEEYAKAHPNSWGVSNGQWFYIDGQGQIYKATQTGQDTEGVGDAVSRHSKYNNGAQSSFSNVYTTHKTDPDQLASGTTSFSGGSVLLNELGTEAIITPEGTLTALPSQTGVVPADITRSLWQLGELSPMIANALLGGVSSSDASSKSYINSVDESLNINSLIMNVSADNSFDVDTFANALRTRMALSKNNKR